MRMNDGLRVCAVACGWFAAACGDAGNGSDTGMQATVTSFPVTTGATTAGPGTDSETAPTTSTGTSTGTDPNETTTAVSASETSTAATTQLTLDTSGDPGSTSTGDGTTGEPPPPCGTIPVVYRDFKPLDTDFGCHQKGNPAWPGLVLPQLGADNKPQYNPNPPPPPNGWVGIMPQITSADSFSQWYNTMDGVNLEIAGELMLTEIMPGIYSFSSSAFYPLTGLGFGNNVTPNWEGDTFPDINGAFTTEIHTTFTYEVGQKFEFSGDDDVWVYIDGKLAMDLGGLHGAVNGSILLDTLGLTAGQSYTLDAFHAERCDSGSNFRIDTSIACFIPG
jgi:fibro-slime domain-containing protein